jgi:L-lactate dehydrogenase complex protein LldG
MTSEHEQARAEILERLRSSLSRSSDLFRSGPGRKEAPALPSPVTGAPGDKWTLARQFAAKLEALHGSAQIVERPSEAVDVVVRLVKQRDDAGDVVLAWDVAELPVEGLASGLQSEGISLFVPDDMHEEACRRRASPMTVGITAVETAFASTGSIVLVPDRGKSRAAALLPLYHVVLIPLSRLHPNIEAWIGSLRRAGRLDDLLRQSAQLAFVTGPSKSADIELNLTLGVHGPKEVHAVLFDDESSEA